MQLYTSEEWCLYPPHFSGHPLPPHFHLPLLQADDTKHKETPNTDINARSCEVEHAYELSLFCFPVQRMSHHSSSLEPVFSGIFLAPGSTRVSSLHPESCAGKVPTLNPRETNCYSAISNWKLVQGKRFSLVFWKSGHEDIFLKQNNFIFLS